MDRRQFLAALALMGVGSRFHLQSSRVEAFLSQMTVRQKIGQLFMFSLGGTSLTEDMQRLIADYHAGGMVLFRYNVQSPRQLTELTNAMQRAAMVNGLPIPLFVGGDQEGGRVQRLKGTGFSDFPNPMALGAADDPDLSEGIGAAIAEEMRACGLNMNLAPVLDVNTRRENPVINVRAFGSDPEKAGMHGAAFIRGTQAQNIIATGKHFPGHGNTSVDSHFELPVVDLKREQLLYEMIPFIEGIDADLACMMTAHILYMGLDNTPATFSAPIMTDLLRGELGFGGLVMSDALTMGAVSQARDNPIYALRDALLAGVDMLAYGALPNGQPPTLLEQIELFELGVRLVESGLVSEARVDESVRRVLLLKEQYALLDWRPQNVELVSERLQTPAHDRLLREVAEASVTLVSDGAQLLPLAEDTPVVVLYPEAHAAAGLVFAQGFASVETVAFPLEGASYDTLLPDLTDKTVICLTVDVARHPSQTALVNLLPASRLIVVALQSPYDILDLPFVQTYLATYGDSAQSMQAARQVIVGRLSAKGRLPVDLFA